MPNLQQSWLALQITLPEKFGSALPQYEAEGKRYQDATSERINCEWMGEVEG
jgi:hypothetical protein